MLPAKLIREYAEKLTAEYGRKVNEEEASASIVATVMEVARNYARGFRFGSYESEDIVQIASLFALECLAKGKYDASRPLENYLHTHVKRRLHNHKRDNFMRPEAPCKCCDPFNPGLTPCSKWEAWNARNGAKQALARSGPAADTAEVRDRGGEAHEIAEIDAWVDETWPASLRADYVRLKQGVVLSGPRMKAVRDRVLARFGEGDDDGE